MKTAALFFFATIVLYVQAVTDDEARHQWLEFQETYQKSYRSPVEAEKRFTIFKQHLEEIEEHNKLYEEGKVTWTEGVNRFSDWTEEELKEYMSHGVLRSAFSSEDQEIQRKWNEFQATYKKSYRSPVEAKKRFEIFRNNVIKMEEHNDLYEQGLVTDKQGINQFADWTEEEFKAWVHKGLINKNVRVGKIAPEEELIQRRWNEFQATYKKSYRSPVEAKKRFEIFKNNVIKIEEHNDLYEQGLVSDKQGINQFADWTEEEFKAWVHKGLINKNVRLAKIAPEEELIQRRWNEFQATYKKSYRSPVEAKRRYEIFKNNVIKMEEHNDLYEQGLVSDKQGINQFSDWTEEEFKNYENKGLLPQEERLEKFVPEEEAIQRRWNEFQATYRKSYRSPVEAKKRFEIFKNNVIKMEEHNDLYEQGLVSDKQGINQFSDWTEEEFKNYENKGLLPKETNVEKVMPEEEEIKSKWTEFQATYRKSYRSPVEAKRRFEIFKNNVIKMEEHNDLYEQGLVSDKQGINQFSDWTEEEFKNYENKGLLPKETNVEKVMPEEEEIKSKWTEFQATYRKSYRSPVEAKRRFEIFKNNVIKMEEHNDLYEQGLVSDKQGINQFSDWTEEEFKNYENKGLLPKETNVEKVMPEEEEIKSKWTEFQATYRKSYRSPVEAKRRFEIFKNNVIKMEEHNDLYEQGLVSDKQGINQFSDWTEEEFKNYENKGLLPQEKNVERVMPEEEKIKNKWTEFQATYKKSYRSPVEAVKRFEIFKNNVIKMEEHNDLYEQGLVSDKQGINRFSDWTAEEFKEYVNKGLLHDATVGTSDDEDMMKRFNEFQKKFGKSYSSAEEAKKRFEIFKENVKKIDEHNAQFRERKTTFEMEINQFTDWTHEELVNWLKDN
ncbi:trichohyalin-like isoform X5 [Harmonia axyridis]|uniref:trichohyalin-like isoform X5 n=1 Tax=Harmonia axyridis TaxID=115357 RepID=UPI001E278BBC|nr:trichohyalin-like isoform X5 [Harmonia axyridis]